MRVLGCYPEMAGVPVGLPGVAEGAGGLRGGVMRGERSGTGDLSSFSFSFRSSRFPLPPGMRVAYQGAPGAYSEGSGPRCRPWVLPLPCEQFSDAFEALSLGQSGPRRAPHRELPRGLDPRGL